MTFQYVESHCLILRVLTG